MTMLHNLAVATSLRAAAANAAPAACIAASGAGAPTVVELYTAEGCSACPPADRWLSTLKGRSDVLALAVRLYRPVAAWAATAGHSEQLSVSPGVRAHPRRVVFVETDAATHRPLQAVALGC